MAILGNIAPALISSAANLLGGRLRNQEARKASARQMAFQQQMSNTSYQRGMEDMRKAGLNPILAGKLGGASTPTGSTYNPENIATNATNAFMQYKQMDANVQQTEAQTAKIIAETGILDETQGSLIGRNIEYIKKAIDKALSTTKEKISASDALDKVSDQLKRAKQQYNSKQMLKRLKVNPSTAPIGARGSGKYLDMRGR